MATRSNSWSVIDWSRKRNRLKIVCEIASPVLVGNCSGLAQLPIGSQGFGQFNMDINVLLFGDCSCSGNKRRYLLSDIHCSSIELCEAQTLSIVGLKLFAPGLASSSRNVDSRQKASSCCCRRWLENRLSLKASKSASSNFLSPSK